MRRARKILARTETATVEQCAAGTVHVTVGYVTLHLAPEALASVARTLNAAVQQREGDATRCSDDLALLMHGPRLD